MLNISKDMLENLWNGGYLYFILPSDKSLKMPLTNFCYKDNRLESHHAKTTSGIRLGFYQWVHISYCQGNYRSGGAVIIRKSRIRENENLISVNKRGAACHLPWYLQHFPDGEGYSFLYGYCYYSNSSLIEFIYFFMFL